MSSLRCPLRRACGAFLSQYRNHGSVASESTGDHMWFRATATKMSVPMATRSACLRSQLGHFGISSCSSTTSLLLRHHLNQNCFCRRHIAKIEQCRTTWLLDHCRPRFCSRPSSIRLRQTWKRMTYWHTMMTNVVTAKKLLV